MSGIFCLKLEFIQFLLAGHKEMTVLVNQLKCTEIENRLLGKNHKNEVRGLELPS